MFRYATTFALLLAAFAPSSARAQTDAQIVRFFDTIALGNEIVKVADPRVHKWTGPVRYFIDEQVNLGPLVRDDLEKHLAKLSRLTRLRFERVNRRADANYRIIFTSLSNFGRTIAANSDPGGQRYLERLTGANCIGVYKVQPPTNAIVSAFIVIPVDHVMSKGLMYRCLVEETTQVMGLPNDDDNVEPSVFNDRSRLDELTWIDELLLRILYDPRMPAGARRDEALAIARQIVPQLRNSR